MMIRDLLSGSKVGDFHGRDNNFNLIRFLAATSVIWTHAFGLLQQTSREPVYHAFGIGAGDLGVDVFFVLSGYLVSKSWDGKTLAEFGWARFLRIYPGLWVSILITVMVAGLFFTNLSAGRFFLNESTITYLLHNATILPKFGAQLTLPHALRYRNDDFNVPLWTLPYELQMYVLLALFGISFGLRARLVASVAAFGVLGVLFDKIGLVHLMDVNRGRFLYLFFVGSLIYVLRGRIVLRAWIAGCAVGLVLAVGILTKSQIVRQATLLLVLPYVLLWCALVPAGWIRQWNKLGDYSYGMYIYGCPIQIALISTGVVATAGGDFLLSMLITVPIAALSWHLLEKRVLHVRLPAFLAFEFPKRAPAPTD